MGVTTRSTSSHATNRYRPWNAWNRTVLLWRKRPVAKTTMAAIQPTNGIYDISAAVRGLIPLMYSVAGFGLGLKFEPAPGCLAPQKAQYTSVSLTPFPHWVQ